KPSNTMPRRHQAQGGHLSFPASVRPEFPLSKIRPPAPSVPSVLAYAWLVIIKTFLSSHFICRNGGVHGARVRDQPDEEATP
ncbi:hypothetical protein NPIL_653481, partial [Nephila pilipes]